MPTIYEVSREHQRRLLAQDSAAADDLIEAYGRAWRRIRAGLSFVTQKIETARAAGEDVSPAWLYRQQRLETVLKQVEREIGEFAQYADARIQRSQRAAISAAEASATSALRAVGESAEIRASFLTTNPAAVRNMIGYLANGSPLRSLLDKLGPETSEQIRHELTSAITLGYGPRQTAERLERSAGLSLDRALRISRTETMRSYRESSLDIFRANSDVITGWVWMATNSPRTCPVCLAMDGSIHPLSEPFGSHVCCRCSPAPVTAAYTGIVGADGLGRESGADWFAGQTPKFQLQLLGKTKGHLYQDGKIELRDLVRYRDDPDWGPERSENTIAQTLAAAAARK